MMRVRIRIMRTAIMSIWLNPFGRNETAIRHFDSAETPIAVPRYVVKLLAAAALDKT